MVAIFAVLLLALVSCVFCHSKRKSTTKDTQPSTSQAQNTIPHEEVVLPAPPERENNERNEVRTLPTEDMECRRGAIKVIQFPDYVQRMCQEDEDNNCMLAYEFKDLQSVPTFTYNVARLSHNTKHNRFKNVYPYDNSRVILTEIPGRNGSDYINASFIQGYDGRQYIAAQGPMRETMGDFWRMIWEYKIKAIVMLTQCVLMSRERCFMYWPEARYGCITPGHNKLSVTFLSSIPYAEYEIRQLKVKNFLEPEDNSLTVTQFHYTAWPDHGVPENVMSVISFIRHVRKALPVSLDQPLLIHCSAGVGRTGTFITLDMMMQQIKAEGILSIYHCVRNLRMQRMQMVQTLHQYKFIHHALSELVVCGETEVTAFDLRTYTDALNEQPDDSGITIARKHYQILEYLSSQHIGDFTVARMEENVNKNRFPNMIPNEVYRVHLKQNNPLDSDYINASFIDGYKMKEAFIATQGPLQNTVEDFWRMMWEYQCGCIVMLCELDEDGEESSYCYWPEEVGEVRVYGWLRVRLELTNSHGDVEERKLEVTNMDDMSNSTEPLIITMLHMSGWTLNTLPHAASIITLHDQLICGQMRASSQLTTVMCSDGVTRTGTFICIHSQLERLKTEGVVDVFQAIKSARIQRAGLIPNLAHYVFCYEGLARFVETLDDYSNFENFMA